MRRLAPVLAALTMTAALTPVAHAGGPTMALGAAEDVVRSTDLVFATTKMRLLRLAGFTSIRVTSQWLPGQVAPTPEELAILSNVNGAAQLTGVRIYVLVYHPGSATTPLTDEAREQFALYTAALLQALPAFQDVIVGNEPNLNRFWLPQFNLDGTNAASPAYLALLARTYDVVKAVNPAIRVWGGALAPRGADRPTGIRPTHSPGAFLRDMGAAYRASGRPLPVMDGLAFHPYADTSAQSPDTPHPNSTTIGLADYPRLVGVLGEAFDGTPQPGSTLPILYDEFGVEAIVPSGKATLYTGAEPATVKPVPETTQAAYYTKALQLAFCQPNVVGLFFFHTQDEPALPAWQSGVYYPDGTAKSSFWAVRDGLRRVRGGTAARCDGLALDVQLLDVTYPTPEQIAAGRREVTFACSLDCRWEVRALRASGATAARVRGYGRVDQRVVASFGKRKFGPQPVTYLLTAVHPLHPGTPATAQGG